MIEYNFSPVFYMNVLKICNGDLWVNSQEILYMTSQVLNDKLYTNFESYIVDIFNEQQSARGSTSIIYVYKFYW